MRVERRRLEAREGWVDTVTDQGLVYCWTDHPDGSLRAYWDETACYAFRAEEVDELERAAADFAYAMDAVTPAQLDRPGRRSNGSVFTVRTLAQYYLHDVVHHLHDVDGG